jgi:hypothetical protein
MNWLLDANVLIALGDQAHTHHGPAVAWFSSHDEPFATCPSTQGSLLRFALRHGAAASIEEAAAILRRFQAHPRHRYWPDALNYADVDWTGVLGHRQVTDAYLVAQARANNGRLVTFDRGLAALHGSAVHLISPPSDENRP